jgi:hypothetical protein
MFGGRHRRTYKYQSGVIEASFHDQPPQGNA